MGSLTFRRARRLSCTWTGIAAVAAALALLSGSPASAQFVCTVTPTDSTCTNNGAATGQVNNATGANQNATTTNNGTNTTASFSASTNAGGNATAVNNGTNTAGFFAMTNAGGNAVATNNGVTGGFSANANNGNATGTNTGTVNGSMTTNSNGTGSATSVNTGTINGGGVLATANIGAATAVNSGTVSGNVAAVTVTNGNATVTNSGNAGGLNASANGAGNVTVTNSGNATSGINAFTTGGGGSVVVTNSGSTGFVQLLAANGSETLTNSGVIIAPVGIPAINFGGGPDTLNLLAGSRIVGAINLVGTNDTVNFLSGNHNLTFNTLAGARVGGAIPFAVSGNRAAAIDATPFGLADRNLMDFTRGISGILGSLGGTSAAANGPISSAFAPSAGDSIAARVDDAFAGLGMPALAYAGDAMVFKNPTAVDVYGRAVWARGFGGEHVQDADGALLRSTTTFFGGAVGFDMVARPDLRLGAFVGGGQTRQALDLNVGHTDTDTVFGGIYGRWAFTSLGAASFLDFALHGGGSRSTTARVINNNLVAGGLETATANYNSFYVSPELKYGWNLPLWSEYTLTPSVQVRYVAGVFDGYTEAGTTAPLTVASRTIQDIEERGELKLTHAMRVGPDLLVTSVHVGALGIERVGDTSVSAVLLGVNMPFVTPGRNTVGGVLGGGGLEWRTREGVSFFGAAEAIGMSDSSTVVWGRGGIRVAF